MRYGVIMAGGSGKRLWPLSRGNTPKQMLPVARGRSLLRLSFDLFHVEHPPQLPGSGSLQDQMSAVAGTSLSISGRPIG